MKPKILVVDDDRQVLAVAAKLLERQDYEVTLALSSSEAAKCLGEQKYRLVITDYNLGIGTGEDVVLCVKKLQPETPIFLMSGDCTQIPVWLRNEHVVARVFSKPFTLALLQDAVRSTLREPGDLAEAPGLTDKARRGTGYLPKGVEEMVHRVVNQESIIAITDKKGTIVYANDRFCEISGYARSELLGQNHRLLKSGVHPSSFYKTLWGAILGGKTWQGEICNKSKDGRLYFVDTTIAPLREEGLITHFVAIRTDITARREAQLALAEREKREENDRHMAALGRMADGVLHDLSNILTGIMGIASEPGGDERNNMLKDAIGRMAQLTRTLRDYSTGRVREPEVFRLNPLLTCACSLVRHRRERPKDLIIEEDTAATKGMTVLGNESQLFEVLLNLLVNAMEASAHTTAPRIKVLSMIRDSRLQILVEDNGHGVPEELAPTLFDPYTSTKGPGRGIGLSVAKSIACAHGGDLAMKRAGGKGQGAIFELSLPLHKGPTPEACEKEDLEPKAQKRVVLVSEDEADVRRMLSQDIGDAGFTMINASDPADLIALASTMKEVLAGAILDSNEVDSESGAVACLRRMSPQLPIVLISGTLSLRGKRNTQWGEVDSLPKPFEAGAVIAALQASLRPEPDAR